jgi:hypothetical protein
LSAAHVVGVQLGVAHWFGTPPPPQICPVGQTPQSTRFPQPSAIGPQLAFASAHVRGWHVYVELWPQTLALPAPPHVSGSVQSPQ